MPCKTKMDRGVYDEWVIDQESQVIPAFILELDAKAYRLAGMLFATADDTKAEAAEKKEMERERKPAKSPKIARDSSPKVVSSTPTQRLLLSTDATGTGARARTPRGLS